MKWRRLIHAAYGFFAVAIVLSASVFLFFRDYVRTPGPTTMEQVLIIPDGASVRKIGQMLSEARVIRYGFLFPLAYRYLAIDKPLKAGEYKFAIGATPKQVITSLVEGRTVIRKLTIPEGLTTYEIYEILRAEDALKGDLPEPVPEGVLMPDTYHYSYGELRSSLVERMNIEHKKFMAEHWAARAQNLPFENPLEAITLASIVEKETSLDAERPRVAAVYINRLRKGMRLQADPTVIYPLSEGKGTLGRLLTFKDLEVNSPYNTYVFGGLPPGPIAHPGRQSLAAVLNPLETDEYYFVADGKGGHRFSKNFGEHEKNVKSYRKEIKAQKQAKKKAVTPIPAVVPTVVPEAEAAPQPAAEPAEAAAPPAEKESGGSLDFLPGIKIEDEAKPPARR